MTMTATAPNPAPRVSFARVVRGESIKAFSTRALGASLLLTCLLALVTVAAIGNLESHHSSAIGPPPASAGAYGLVMSAIPILLIWAAYVFFGDVPNGVLRSTYIAVPHRGTVFLAKSLFASIISGGAVFVLTPVCYTTYALATGQQEALTYVMTPAGMWLTARLVLIVMCWTLIAVSVAAIARTVTVTVGVIVSLYLFIEAYLVNLSSARWLAYVLPFSSGKAVIPELSEVALPNAGWAALGQFATTAVLTVLAWLTTTLRDAK
jgi:membrane protein